MRPAASCKRNPGALAPFDRGRNRQPRYLLASGVADQGTDAAHAQLRLFVVEGLGRLIFTIYRIVQF